MVVVDDDRINFSELHAEFASGRQDRLRYYLFDRLWLDGKDLRKHPQVQRKALLKELFETYELEARFFTASISKEMVSKCSRRPQS